jgi:sirohydrochlorin cobaltochelatase
MIAGGDNAQGLILFAHGARDPGWAEPLELLAAKVRDRAPGRSVRLAFLELMQPDLSHAAAELVDSGVTAIRIVPIFLGQGGHLRRDLPALVEGLRARHPGIAIECAPPAGEDEGVLDALAAYCAGNLT